MVSPAFPTSPTSGPERRPALTDLAGGADPYPAYRALGERGPCRRPEGWVLARWPDVADALDDPALVVTPGDDRGGAAGREGGVAWWRSRMARFSDGTAHPDRRAAAELAIADIQPVSLEHRARARAGAALDGAVERPGAVTADGADRPGAVTADGAERPGAVTADGADRPDHARLDGMALARSVPATVLAEALGLDDATASEAASLAGVVAAALAPRPGTEPARCDAQHDDAARALAALLTPVARGSGSRTDAVAAAMATLVQARDATAGLIGNALVAWARLPAGPVDPAVLVERALRHDPPVHWTRRTATAPTDVGGQHIEPGDSLWLLLAPAGVAAGSGPDPEAGNPATTFGSGQHRCPGRHLAPALARGVLAAVADRQLRPVVADPPGYEPRPNLRIPTAVALRPA